MVEPSVRRLRSLFALALALIVLLEGAGVARAMGADSITHCCCGTHATARICDCASCPIKLRRSPHTHEIDRLSAPTSCAPSTDDGVLVVLATIVMPPSFSVSSHGSRLEYPSQLSLPDVSLSPHRPPP